MHITLATVSIAVALLVFGTAFSVASTSSDDPPPSAPVTPSKPAAPAAPAPDAPATPPAPSAPAANKDLFALKLKTLDGKPFDLAAQRGKVLLIVNVASKCGYTPQYAQLEKLHQKYKDRGLVVIGVPSNDFGAQEPGSSEEIRDFCTKNYGVTFPLLEKLRTKSGDEQSELYGLLDARTKESPNWNFCKYLVTRDGTQTSFFASKVAPDSPEMVKAIETALEKAAPSGK